MKIVVLVKEVPDTWGDRELDLETGLALRDAGDRVVDEIDERAIELAVVHAESHPDTEVVAVSMGPEWITSSLRRSLALGANTAVHVLDDRLLGADIALTAEVLAAVVTKLGFDLVIAGNQSTDGNGGVVPAMIAEHLNVPEVTAMQSVEIAERLVSGRRQTETATAQVQAELPAVISITDALPDARMPNFKGIQAAKKKPIEVLTLDDLGIVVNPATTPSSILTAIATRPPRTAGVKLVGDPDAGTKLADFLIEKRLA